MGTGRVQSGEATSDLVPTARVGGNSRTFADVLALHVPEGSRVADVTYGRGVFWRDVDPSRYELLASDLADGTDARDLPYADGSLDALVLDPPYMEGAYRRPGVSVAGTGSHAAFGDYYGTHGVRLGDGDFRYHDAVLDVYLGAVSEAARTLREGGVLIVKCQDEVSSNAQRLTHVEVADYCLASGFVPEDLFVVVRPNRPSASRVVRQVHARKNHSYFMVFRRDEGAAARRVGSLRRLWEAHPPRGSSVPWDGRVPDAR